MTRFSLFRIINFSLICRNNWYMKGLLLLLLLIPLFCFGETEFSGLDLADNNTLLFKAGSDSPVYGNYETLFLVNLKSKQLQQLTAFPEQAAYLADAGILQIHNRFGLFRSDGNLKNFSIVPSYRGFIHGDEIETGKIDPIGASPDGLFILYITPTSAGYGDLILLDMLTQKKLVISRQIERSLDALPTAWSPDSDFFVYSKKGQLYYFALKQLEKKRVLTEAQRKIGTGKIPCTRWGKDGYLYYIKGTVVYRIYSSEFFTRSLYSGMLEIGEVSGKIPFAFDANFDSFWLSPDGQKILLNKGGRNIFLYYLNNTDYLTVGDSRALPYINLPRNTRIRNVLWQGNTITLLASSIIAGKNHSAVLRIDNSGNTKTIGFQETKEKNIKNIVLSQDGTKIALFNDDQVLVKDYLSWTDLHVIKHQNPLHVFWIGDNLLLVLGSHATKTYNLEDGSSKTLFFNQPGQYGFGKENGKVTIKTGDEVYELESLNSWKKLPSFDIEKFKSYSTDFRVYLEQLVARSYRNIVMVRNIKGYGTVPLFREPLIQYEPFPKQEGPVDMTNFFHGSRIRRREVALVFNAIDTVEGLTEILNTLADYNIRCTFFVNGVFIRRYPDAVKEIADSGHEVGSLFYTYFNMTDAKYQVDSDFVIKGLGKNEDDYFKASGREISLLWHAPFYQIRQEFIAAAGQINYTYIGRDVESLDWIPKYGAAGFENLYLPAARLVERITRIKKPGSIIPIRIGKTDGERDDYLFTHLDLLIDNLISRGYSIVTVSTLMEHAE